MAASDEDFTHDCRVVLQACLLCGCVMQIGTHGAVLVLNAKRKNTKHTHTHTLEVVAIPLSYSLALGSLGGDLVSPGV